MIKRFKQYNESIEENLPSEDSIPTAEEFIPDDNLFFINAFGHGEETCLLKSDIPKVMIEFAKLHVKAALKSAIKNIEHEYPNPSIDKNLILNAYPENKIKQI